MLGGDSGVIPAWSPIMLQSVETNYDSLRKEPIYVQIASVRSTGAPKLQRLVFLDFLSADPKVLIFAAATRNSELMSVTKGSQTHEIFWQMPRSGETFTITGRMYIVAAPTMSHRFGAPPRRIALGSTSTNPDEFWESQRLSHWKKLSPQYRATFTWPAAGEPHQTLANEGSVYREANSVRIVADTHTGYKYTRLDAMDEDVATGGAAVGSGFLGAIGNAMRGGGNAAAGGSEKDQELRCVHNAALDNFCLLVLKAQRVDHYSPNPAGSGPPTRTVDECLKDGSWVRQNLNP
ncbi:uncharacterized protein EV422DRAFT_391315 [Fimicolochytrium jonesii]|uniref:uncharacterized protein n=1 Tax=Fimicolochytrium jonesii TaxID=1396493 RepID=UPI0022FE17AF|nr:uncharacterized protein EV422DRAFT_391315 [Fimicolochytrium jonesii]KAI8823084.1 hypothetical protein EV422DRAFT_391315 [Fimicolochytrium jonesii]